MLFGVVFSFGGAAFVVVFGVGLEDVLLVFAGLGGVDVGLVLVGVCFATAAGPPAGGFAAVAFWTGFAGPSCLGAPVFVGLTGAFV